ncbi:hypothetical protein AN189_01590 [Loktanella sp. 3ANDIMAR09]|uniref:DUF1761 domain-containing protein n=1 Tax=Loktanella sp. 3ANDIMAR09 TaxID=1225657 RepID=UPI0006F7B0C7|nr:DUF1761 domain-containing protein [Loktanella sp. 3ANDIMAR09]KQI70116.1 hypothetical protein AN189_01590 [Loktanella sp. 3ANDIMAR09]
MGFADVIGAAAAAFVFGAIWYGVLSKPWIRAAGVVVRADGKPVNSTNPWPYAVSGVMILLVAGMMRHIFTLSAIDTIIEGLTSGFGLGAFIISPWLILTVGFEGRPWSLGLINAGYASLGCAIMGAVLILLA